MKTNTAKRTEPDRRMDTEARLAGGTGARAAVQPNEQLLNRVVMTNLLWEDSFYESGAITAEHIRALVPLVEPATVARIARQARIDQGLRHVPLFLAIQMLKHPAHRSEVRSLLPDIVGRADGITEALAMYWAENGQGAPIAAQLKRGLRDAFANFDNYQLSKYQGKKAAVSMRDAVRLLRPVPTDRNADFFKELSQGNVTPPDTWEVALSAGADKKEAWERLLTERRLPTLAFLRNLDGMERAGVNRALIREAFATLSVRWMLPINFIAAAEAAPRWSAEIEGMMFRTLKSAPVLPGWSVFVVDVSGSMMSPVSGKSKFSRMKVAAAMTMLAREMAERITIYVTAGSDPSRKHKTKLIPAGSGFGLMNTIMSEKDEMGGGGIFTRQALEFIKADLRDERPDRIIVFSDSQDCDYESKRVPAPFGLHNYIVDVSSHARGVNYEGIWTAEITGWSPKFLEFIAAYEGLSLYQGQDQDQDDDE